MQVLAPTRELAKQVAVEFEVMAPSLGHLCIYGGAMYGPQESALRRGLDVVVSADDIVLPFCCLPLRASVCTWPVTPRIVFDRQVGTPGRVLDHLDRGTLRLRYPE